MSNSKGRPVTGGPADDLLRQEIDFILAQAIAEPWVIREAEAIATARAVKAVWCEALGLVA